MRGWLLGLMWAGVAEAAEVELQSAGEGERRVLQYEVSDGQREKMHLVFDMEMAMDAMGTKRGGAAPTLDAWADMTAHTLPDGNFEVAFVYKKVKAKGGSGDLADPKVAEGLAKLKGLSGTYTVSPYGEILSTDIHMPEGFAGGQGLPFDMREIGARLPSEAVGVGAVWAVRSLVSTQIGMSFDQTATYHLVALDGASATLTVDIVQSAEPGPIDASAAGVDGLPAGAINLDHLNSAGSGRTVIRLDRLVPREGEMQMHMDMSMSMQMMGMAMTFAQDLKTHMDITGK
ncbi:MAG TPA: hypothetical protein PKA64_14595 [Myxococcota bacterium]|nr:hypothetical protein [Myxococcota bacterium]